MAILTDQATGHGKRTGGAGFAAGHGPVDHDGIITRRRGTIPPADHDAGVLHRDGRACHDDGHSGHDRCWNDYGARSRFSLPTDHPHRRKRGHGCI